MAEKYDPIRLESYGLVVTMHRHQADIRGTRDQLLDADVVADTDFPVGRRVIGCRRFDEFGNTLELRRVRPDYFCVRLYWSADFDAWLKKGALVQARTDALPKNAADYRAALRQAVGSAVDQLRRTYLDRPLGGYRLVTDRADLVEAFGPLFQLIENAKVKYSPLDRAAEVRRLQGEVALLDPRAKAFVRRVVRDARAAAEPGDEPDLGPPQVPSTAA